MNLDFFTRASIISRFIINGLAYVYVLMNSFSPSLIDIKGAKLLNVMKL